MGYDCSNSLPFDFEPNGKPFGSKSKGKLLLRSYPIQCERKWKYSFLSVHMPLGLNGAKLGAPLEPMGTMYCRELLDIPGGEGGFKSGHLDAERCPENLVNIPAGIPRVPSKKVLCGATAVRCLLYLRLQYVSIRKQCVIVCIVPSVSRMLAARKGN